ncbi:DNA-directed RNA polymerase subunit delta [Heliorestis acidaminivorans]|uniref:RNAP delta factor n=1 Tax=Heliorestis acidaminivorans TaxID=553427 RepID=A0A6I0F364_9FIRM|nr:DNA-directed RNA polymerase subunit delta [Heliorestis acidaminivorans]KAB2953833.1 DNA-directed RNA polymerase subunit delta [Heliorestis acidaminivorans]
MAELMEHQDFGRRFSEAEQIVQVLREKGEALHFRDLIAEVLKRKGYENPTDIKAMARLYTQMNLDMRFVYLGDGLWGLRNWAPATAVRKIPTISLLNKSVDYDDSDGGDDDEYGEKDSYYSRNREED